MARLSKSRILSALQCPRKAHLEAHRPDLAQYSAQTLTAFATGHEVGDQGVEAGARPRLGQVRDDAVRGDDRRLRLVHGRVGFRRRFPPRDFLAGRLADGPHRGGGLGHGPGRRLLNLLRRPIGFRAGR